MPLLTRNTCPSGCRRCISRTFHGMSAGGKVISRPAATHCLWTASTSSTQTDIQAPLSAVWSPSCPNVEAFAPLPRPPWPPWQRKISHWPDPTAPKVGGVPQSQHFLQPHFSNQAKLAEISETFSIGVTPFASMPRKDNTGVSQRSEAGPYRSVVSANAERCAASDEDASHFGAEERKVIFWGAWNRRKAWRRPEALMVHLRGVGHARCSCPDRGQRRRPGSIRWNRSGRSR